MPVIMLAFSYILGIIGYTNHNIQIILPVLALISCVLYFRKITSLQLALGLYLFCFLGFLNMDLREVNSDFLSRIRYLKNADIKATVANIPEKSNENTRLRFYANVKSLNDKEGKAKILVVINNSKGEFQNIKIGDLIEAKGLLTKPYRASNPWQFDYAKYLQNIEVFNILYLNENNNYKIISTPKFSFNNSLDENKRVFLRNLDLTRDFIMQKHSKYIKSPALEVLGGIVFGDDAVNPPDDVKEMFKNSGLLHLLAASGLNVGLIFFMWFWLAQKLKLGFKISIISSMFLIVIYSFMTGFPPSILRASVMLLFVLAGKLFQKEANTLNLIFFVCLLMLAFNPKMLFNVGFQLSFTVTAGLIICTEPILNLVKSKELTFRNIHQTKPKFFQKILYFISPQYLTGIIVVPFVAQLFATPLQMYYFNTFAPYSVLANIFVVPFIGIISFFGFFNSVLSLLPFDFILKILDSILTPLINGVLNISWYFSNLPFALMLEPSPNWFQITLYYLIICLLITNLLTKFKKKKYYLPLVCIFVLFCATYIRLPNKNFEIVVFDVGNADSFLIKTPSNKHIMIDTGSLPFRGHSSVENIVLKYLVNKRVKQIDILILTNFDNDHIGGSLDLFKNIKVNKVFISKNDCDTKYSCNILRYLEDNKKDFEVAKNNEKIFEEENLKIYIYKSEERIKKKSESQNENSIITLVTYKNTNSLFMGDAGVESWNNIRIFLPNNIDFLKLGHHGARNVVNQEMLEALNPYYTVISVGRNKYGHPSPETLKTLKLHGKYVFMTKTKGFMKFIYDEDSNLLEPYFYENKALKRVFE